LLIPFSQSLDEGRKRTSPPGLWLTDLYMSGTKEQISGNMFRSEYKSENFIAEGITLLSRGIQFVLTYLFFKRIQNFSTITKWAPFLYIWSYYNQT
jgi:hypothetical protein